MRHERFFTRFDTFIIDCFNNLDKPNVDCFDY